MIYIFHNIETMTLTYGAYIEWIKHLVQYKHNSFSWYMFKISNCNFTYITYYCSKAIKLKKCCARKFMRWNILIYGCSQKGKKWKMVELYLNFLCKITLVMSAYIQTRIILKEKLFLYNATGNYHPLRIHR